MPLHPRLFNRFLIITAGFTAMLIVWVAVAYPGRQRDRFAETVRTGTDLATRFYPAWDVPGDSLSLMEYRGRWVLLQFWSTWSEPSLAAHAALSAEHRWLVVAASVRDDSASVADYSARTRADFRWVQGTAAFQSHQVPGVPTFVLFDPEGTPVAVEVGHPDASTVDRLRALLP